MKPANFFLILLLLSSNILAADKSDFELSSSQGKVKVFILAGQSNMEGRGFPEPLAWQVTQEKYRDRYTHFIKDGDFEAFTQKIAETSDPENNRKPPTYLWSVRRDVWINYLGKHGDLTVGYGAPREGFGPEFNFGHVVGNHFDEQLEPCHVTCRLTQFGSKNWIQGLRLFFGAESTTCRVLESCGRFVGCMLHTLTS